GGAPYNAPLFLYFKKYLLQKCISVFKFTYPENWTRDQIRHFRNVLFTTGYIGVFEDKKYGLVALACSFMGQNLFYSPKKILVANPLLAGVERTIGKDCVLFTLQETPSFGDLYFNPASTSVLDIIDYYAEQMALASQALNSNFVNSQLAYIFTTDNKSSAEAFKKMFEMIASGEPAVVQDKNLLNEDGSPAWQAFQQNLAQTYIANDILTSLSGLNDQFCTLVGIPNANTEKKERLIVDEANANNVETTCLSDLWLENMQKCCDEVNAMFGVDMKVEKRYNMEEQTQEDYDDEISDN
ncbi:MAG: hypothetical protein IIZ78_09570, partial [Clostridiales bacterium]|nr:hypothetical protein [Clostridiales bacterium]